MRLIDADKFECFGYDRRGNEFESLTEAYDQGVLFVLEKIDEAPTIEVPEIKSAHWKWQEDICGDRECICSSCRGELPYTFIGGTIDEPFIKKEYIEETDYCPHCGAKMDEK